MPDERYVIDVLVSNILETLIFKYIIYYLSNSFPLNVGAIEF